VRLGWGSFGKPPRNPEIPSELAGKNLPKPGLGRRPPYRDFSAALTGLTDRQCVLDAAGAPQLVHAARNAKLRAVAENALVDLAVVSDVTDDAGGPVFGETELFAVRAFRADQPHDLRLGLAPGDISPTLFHADLCQVVIENLSIMSHWG